MYREFIMTHEELLAKINEKIENVESVSLITAIPWRILRAVIELHQPQDKQFEDEHEYCIICPDFEYPCKTIQAIEVELK
jgi:hypothetical protein